MSIRKINFCSQEYYHIYNRGNGKRDIFHDSLDYDRFVKLIYISNGSNSFKIDNISRDIYVFERGERLVSIGAYCLMPNHFHLLLTQNQEGGISKFMQEVSTGYVMFYNKKYDRTGSLFEGKFKSRHVDNDNYLKYLFSYIHLNPLKLINPNWEDKKMNGINNIKSYISRYTFSSYPDFIGHERIQGKVLNLAEFPEYFLDSMRFKDEMFEWFTYRQDL